MQVPAALTVSRVQRPDSSALRFSTEQFARRDRISAWREIVGRTVCQVEIEPLSGDRFSAAATLRALPRLGVISATSSPLRYVRPRHLRNSDDVVLTIVMECCEAAECGRDVALGPGDATFSSADKAGTYHLPSGGRHIGLRVPRTAISPLVNDVDSAMCRHIPAQTPALQLLTRYLDILDETRALESPAVRRHAATHIHDLMALAIGATSDAGEVAKGRGVRAARLAAIRQEIAKNLERKDLSVAEIALRHRCTPRYVQMLFDDEGTTFSEYVLAQRLARAHRLLSDPRRAAEKIASVAHDCGFGNLSYFNQAFRRRFGDTPSGVRMGAKLPDA
jgi:AraC-like DNA-binding protein